MQGSLHGHQLVLNTSAMVGTRRSSSCTSVEERPEAQKIPYLHLNNYHLILIIHLLSAVTRSINLMQEPTFATPVQ